MKQSSTRNNRLIIVRVLALCLTLASVSLAVAQSNDSAQTGGRKACSNRTIAGDYGVQIEGTILGPNLPLRTLVMEHFDGAGNFTSGIYSVNPDCTGSVSLDTGPGNPPLNYHFVIVDKGRQILLVVDRNAIRGVGYRVD